MKIFISYARVDKPHCNSIVELLHSHKIWYDQRLYAGQNWWNTILRRLEWCDVFIYLLSPASVKSIYCQKELKVARRLGRSIIPVLIKDDTVIPDSLTEFHYVDMSGSLTPENVAMLIDSVWLIEREMDKSKTTERITTETPIIESNDTQELIRQAGVAMEKGDYDNAIVLLEQAKEGGYEYRFTRLDKLLNMAKDAVEEIAKLEEAKFEYQNILRFYQFESMRQFACESFQDFRDEFPNYDPKGLAARCDQFLMTKPYKKDSNPPDTRQELFPMLEWCDIPAGHVDVPSVESNGEFFGEMAVEVEAFRMSRYPITNAQFQLFIDARDGYRNKRWWKFSKRAYEWYRSKGGAQKSRYTGDNRPRESINWYEAMAFCHWMSYTLNLRITLPTVPQWQRAALGDDGRTFPFGNEYHEDYCNSYESKLKMTTRVNRYKLGQSPYGVYDMAGNVWELTLDRAAPNEENHDYRRAMIGGSFVSPYERAKVSSRYYIDPRIRYHVIGFRVVNIKRPRKS